MNAAGGGACRDAQGGPHVARDVSRIIQEIAANEQKAEG